MTTIVTATELHRLMHCIGSRVMPRAVPADTDREQRDKGNAEHWLAEQMFRRSYGDHPVEGDTAPNGYVITGEMLEAVSTYVSALDCGEMEVDTSYAGDGWEVRGRADHISWRCHPNDQHETPRILTIDDYKSGYRLVEPEMNWTLISHAIGWCIRNNATPETITLRIHQPRPYHSAGSLREWSFDYAALMGFYQQIAARLSNPTDELVTGLDHCAKCHALAICPAARQAGMNAIDAASMAFDDTLPKEALTFELETLRHAVSWIENRRDAVNELITHRIKSGEVFDDYVLERRYGQRRWKTGLSGKALSMMAGVDLTKDGIVTPAEAERRGVNKDVIATLVDRPMLDPKLKRIDVDQRARAAFGSPGGE